MHLIFRVDGDAQIGAGHLYRCLTLANAMKAAGHSCVFLCSRVPDGFGEKVTEAGHRLHLIQSNVIGADLTYGWENSPAVHADQLADWEACQNALSEFSVDLVIVDHYLLDQTWESQWAGVPLMVIDDLANREHECSYLLDQNFGCSALDYQGLVPAECELLLGASYSLLRDEFARASDQAIRARETRKAERILINFGAADAGGLTLPVSEALAQAFPDYLLRVICGRQAEAAKQLSKLPSRFENVEVQFDAINMAASMAWADIAVGSGGVTALERCCSGLPAVVLTTARNQQVVNERLMEAGAIIMTDGVGQTVSAVGQFLDSTCDLQASAAMAAAVTDGRGIDRVVRVISHLEQADQLTLRKATDLDAVQLWRWRNDLTVRKMARNTAPVRLSDHLVWLNQVLRSRDQILLIAEQAEQQVGMLRFDLEGQAAEVSITVAPSARGRSLGKALLGAGHRALREDYGISLIIAFVREENAPSLALFERCGYSRTGKSEEGLVQFNLQIT